MIDILIGILALILIFFLPGFFLVLIIFPKRGQLSSDFDLLFKAALGIALSIFISIMIVIILDQLDALGDSPATMSLNLWLVMGVLTVSLGIIAWMLGGLRDHLMALIKPSLASQQEVSDELHRYMEKKRKLQEKLAFMESEEYQSDDMLKEEASVRIPKIKKEIVALNKEIDRILAEKEKEGES
ncbi:MAG: DUF1616 domain-containing protein [Thermoplasmata archaeon]|nr:DUF1616 domain-containing protein [Thermoplasmata archaeon]